MLPSVVPQNLYRLVIMTTEVSATHKEEQVGEGGEGWPDGRMLASTQMLGQKLEPR